MKFVQQRLIRGANQEVQVKFHDALHLNKGNTFASLYEIRKKVGKTEKEVILQTDRNILQRILVAYQAGRNVRMNEILKHELMAVPLALAETNGMLKSGDKALLADALIGSIHCPESVPCEGQSCLVIDGQALVRALGRLAKCVTFGDYANEFVHSVTTMGSQFKRIDVTFDRYDDPSIKDGTRSVRAKGIKLIRRIIDSPNVPLPKDWDSFIGLGANKADLAKFLSHELIDNAPDDKVIIVSGGFQDKQEAKSNQDDIDLSYLRGNHEEADTRIILHSIHAGRAGYNTIVVHCRDTDVLVLLISHLDKIQAPNVWMKGGTSQAKKYYPIRAVANQYTQEQCKHLPSFHALTGSDTTSFIAGHSKKTAFRIFLQYHQLLEGLGDGDLTAEKMKKAEQFVCLIYNLPETITSSDSARCELFATVTKQDNLPPTSDALSFHIQRTHYQSFIWLSAHITSIDNLNPCEHGWFKNEDRMKPKLLSLNPIPENFEELASCQCRKGCNTRRCSCRRNGLWCTQQCKCRKPITNVICINQNN